MIDIDIDTGDTGNCLMMMMMMMMANNAVNSD